MLARALVLLAFALCACNETRSPEAPATAHAAPTTPPAPVGQPEPEPARDPAPEGDEPEDEAPLDVERMNEDELETACFEGSQAACDRLGH